MSSNDYLPPAPGALKLKGSTFAPHKRKRPKKSALPLSNTTPDSAPEKPSLRESSITRSKEEDQEAEEVSESKAAKDEEKSEVTGLRVGKTAAEIRYEERRRKKVVLSFLVFPLPACFDI